jgi:hypothetical protein
VTSSLQDANLGGLAGADATCQSLATNARLPGTFKAWLSAGATSASDRLTHSQIPYVLTDGTVVANNWSELVSGALRHAINLTELKTTPAPTGAACAPVAAFTSTTRAGAAYTIATCQDWTSVDPTVIAVAGSATSTNQAWTSRCISPCAIALHLYCIEQ